MDFSYMLLLLLNTCTPNHNHSIHIWTAMTVDCQFDNNSINIIGTVYVLDLTVDIISRLALCFLSFQQLFDNHVYEQDLDIRKGFVCSLKFSYVVVVTTCQ